MKKILILSLFFTLLSPVLSQNFKSASQHTIDSLIKLLPYSGLKEQIFILNTLASYYAPLDFDSSIMYASQAIRLATIHTNSFDIGRVRVNIGNAYYHKMDFKNALVSYLSAQSILEKGPYLKELGELCLMLGHINFFIMRGEKAISYYRKALVYFQAANAETSLSAVYDAMGLTMNFLNCGPIDSALIYGYKQLNYSRKYHNHYLEARALSDIGMFYSMEDKSVLKKQKALAYCDSALKLATKLDSVGLISIINLNLGGYYDRSSPLFEFTGNLVLSRTLYEKAYSAARKIGSIYLQAIILNYLAEIDIEEGKYHQAKINLDLSGSLLNVFFQTEWKKTPVDVGNSVGKIFEYFLAQREQTAMYYARFKLAMARGEYRKAVEYFQYYYQSRDTMNAGQQGRQFELLIAEDETEKQAQKIRTLAQDNEFNQLKLSRTRFIFIVTGGGIILVSIILLLFFQRRRLKAEQRSVTMEQRLLRAQMNPHFIFNSLASIQNFVINENSDQASIYLSRFSQLIRNILDNSSEEYVSLEKEISTIENYLELQKVRYAGKFEYNISVDEMIDKEKILIPPMLAQPFIENAIEHGMKHKETAGHIDIRFLLRNEMIQFEVRDDGVGREKAFEIESKQRTRHRSMATSLSRDRLNTLNKKLKKKIRLEISDLKDAAGQGCGTRVEFGIPVVPN
ncbi:MAG: histidine kinase [Bacteroidales bacterium]|jgi:tetratricopeptide (TPR) repeat protein|nr:histidine kinase [Bacteroidales bacterium]